jgi:hypothetical protein
MNMEDFLHDSRSGLMEPLTFLHVKFCVLVMISQMLDVEYMVPGM